MLRAQTQNTWFFSPILLLNPPIKPSLTNSMTCAFEFRFIFVYICRMPHQEPVFYAHG